MVRLPLWIKDWVKQNGTLLFFHEKARTVIRIDEKGLLHMRTGRLYKGPEYEGEYYL
jgi:hypothetical protein